MKLNRLLLSGSILLMTTLGLAGCANNSNSSASSSSSKVRSSKVTKAHKKSVKNSNKKNAKDNDNSTSSKTTSNNSKNSKKNNNGNDDDQNSDSVSDTDSQSTGTTATTKGSNAAVTPNGRIKNKQSASVRQNSNIQLGLNDVAVWTDNNGVTHHVDSDGMDRQTTSNSSSINYQDWSGSLPSNAQVVHSN